MTREETLRTAELIKELGKSVNVIVVEHDMEFVRHLDVPVTVFHQGNVFAQGSLDELRQDERILDIYLGRGGKAVA
jgi:branched-chain amino acid transport system permease protein